MNTVRAVKLEDITKQIGPVARAWLLIFVLVLFQTPVGALDRSTVEGSGAFIGAVRGLRNRQVAEERRRRRQFAEHVESKIRDLDQKARWSHHQFAELEAEVEVQGAIGWHRWMTRVLRGSNYLEAREIAFQSTRVQQRETHSSPRGSGSGKSVALRFVALKLARIAMRRRHPDAVIPLYVNLKFLQPGDRAVNAELIREFVLERFKGSTSAVDRFLDDEFAAGLETGRWLFLFDSFDEIPDVLSSTSADERIVAYSDAIYTFMHSFNDCRGIVASRQFRSPAGYDWPMFRIVSLSERRRRELVRKAHLAELEDLLWDAMSSLDETVASLASNPLFLGVLCEALRETGAVPSNSHNVFEAYVARRLEQDRARVEERYGLAAEELRTIAESIAFTMAAVPSFGLSPERHSVTAEMSRLRLEGWERAEVAMDALVYIKLASLEADSGTVTSDDFTFAHRRFQEYFATCVVLREPDRLPAPILLTDGRWRETAVTLFQMQPVATPRLLEAAQRLLESERARSEASSSAAQPRVWSMTTLHVLGVLQAGFAGQPSRLPDSLRFAVSDRVRAAFLRGSLIDQKWALEIAGTATEETLAAALTDGYRGRSRWLRDVAYRQTARLAVVSDESAAEIGRMLIRIAASGRLRREWPTVRAELSRVKPSGPLLGAARLLRLAPMLYLGACFVSMVIAPVLLLSDVAVLFDKRATSFSDSSHLLPAGDGHRRAGF